MVNEFFANQYETVAKSQTAQAIGATGAIGDVIKRIVIVPETTGAGTVTLIDGPANSAITTNLIVAGTLADLTPIVMDLDIASVVVGGWKITTGDNVHVIAIGKFS